MKLRSLAIGLSLLTAGTVIGVSSQHFASAEISSGDRPVLVPIEPCRLVDTRPGAGVGPRATPLGTAETLVVDAQQAATPCTGAIPAEALSLALNVTAIGATAGTFLTIWADGDRPVASSLNPAPGQPPTPNAVTADLAADQTFRVYNDLGNVGLLVDVVGYYEHHNHDDRYYTEAEVDALIPAVDIIGFPANSLNYGSSGTVTQGSSSAGLQWQNSFVGGAILEIPRPLNWNGTSDVVLEVSYFRTTATAGAVEFFARPSSQDVGDDVSTGIGVGGSADANAGANVRRVSTIELPADRLDDGLTWKIGIQRDSTVASAYPDDVIVSSVSLAFGTR